MAHRRALLLLEADAKRRASEVRNQPGQHVPAALAMLARALDQVGRRRLPHLAQAVDGLMAGRRPSRSVT